MRPQTHTRTAITIPAIPPAERAERAALPEEIAPPPPPPPPAAPLRVGELELELVVDGVGGKGNDAVTDGELVVDAELVEEGVAEGDGWEEDVDVSDANALVEMTVVMVRAAEGVDVADPREEPL